METVTFINQVLLCGNACFYFMKGMKQFNMVNNCQNIPACTFFFLIEILPVWKCPFSGTDNFQ